MMSVSTLPWHLLLYLEWFIKLLFLQEISGLKLGFKRWLGYPLVYVLLFSITPFVAVIIDLLLSPFLLIVVLRSIAYRGSKSSLLFYGLFPFVVYELFNWLIGAYLQFLLGWNFETLLSSVWIQYLMLVLLQPFYWLLMRGLRIDFKQIQDALRQKKLRNVVLLLNTSMILYSLLIRIFTRITEVGVGNREIDMLRLDMRWHVVILYFFIFMGLLFYLNYTVKEWQEEELKQAKDSQLQAMNAYSHHIESLYKEIRSFRHDYTNLLVSLQESIKNRDIDLVESIYQTVIADSDKQFYESKYDVANLVNLQNDAMKSIVSSKLIAAQKQGIDVAVEIVEPIDIPRIEPIEMMTIVSIFLDNAIEAAAQAESPNLSLVYFEEQGMKILIIENSTKEERINTKEIYGYGTSSKGKDRGIGLANVKNILQHYPTVSLRTNSGNYRFSQEIRFGK
ncbi:GHKL domain-containing protein [Streptococcus sp. zg-86]|uniref:GHKL domain-containing protein n=1 Tax=Streptococcus zhangguiae TaxID=2664091 RepID=A0A6I4RH23_9STRE|nr:MULTISPECIES: GHKL domain-containing protein [unclassified Streptococcus]MTB64139.1 GHKL domain-containing protein [Streptococcus sp. zg-86]MTB90535.1 GHKL domain-containing protein [Streptococcus sp. zg-36]MWV56127.1 GHKL domain-containing protein [Streptococcus sp. zg-70]QTH48249.1 GHKL domain-containing protein [Streptococcus sp. zg-86]